MATIAVFLSQEKVGIARVKAPGNKPSYSSVQWRIIEDGASLLAEPLMLASLIREMVGDEEKYDVYLNVWPGAYNAVMFSHDKKGRGDLNRLRQSELETVFHGEVQKLYTLDLNMNKGKPGLDGKCRRIIFTIPKERVQMLKECLHQQKMKLQRIAPMDVACAEGVMKYWAPKDETINVCMVLDEACTSVIFLKGGVLHAMRTVPNGFGSVLASYENIGGLDHDACLEMIRQNGVHVTEDFDMPTIQDDVLRLLNRLAGETVKTLHNTFGDEAVIDKLLLCGNFVSTVGLPEYLNTMLDIECTVASAESMPGAVNAIVLDEADFADMFPVAATAAQGADLMFDMKKAKSDKITNGILCGGVAVVVCGVMAVTPIQKFLLQQQWDEATGLLDQPEYVAVKELVEQRDALNRHKSDLIAAIEALPHGGTNTAGIITELEKITAKYGNVQDVSVDYSGKSISLSFLTSTYDSYVYWQKEITESGIYSFISPPEFAGSGMMFTVNASLTSTEFEKPVESAAAEGNG